jgi:hypothetical protein
MKSVFAFELSDGPRAFCDAKVWAHALAVAAWPGSGLIVVDQSGGDGVDLLTSHCRDVPCTIADSLEEAVEMCPDLSPVIVEQPIRHRPDISHAVPAFRHPPDAIYLFGNDKHADSTRLLRSLPRPPAAWLSIASARGVYSFMAATIVAWNRYVQLGGRDVRYAFERKPRTARERVLAAGRRGARAQVVSEPSPAAAATDGEAGAGSAQASPAGEERAVTRKKRAARRRSDEED